MAEALSREPGSGVHMNKSIIAQSIAAIAAAALVAGVTVVLTSGAAPESAELLARTELHRSQTPQQPQATGERSPVVAVGAACSSQGWPNYAQSCQFDLRRSAAGVRKVRVLDLARHADTQPSTNVVVASR